MIHLECEMGTYNMFLVRAQYPGKRDAVMKVVYLNIVWHLLNNTFTVIPESYLTTFTISFTGQITNDKC
jgi:hypothetical protein